MSGTLSIPAIRPRRPARDGARRLGWWMMAPTLAVLAANSIFPLIYALTVSFKNYQILIPVPHRWVGFANYSKIFQRPSVLEQPRRHDVVPRRRRVPPIPARDGAGAVAPSAAPLPGRAGDVALDTHHRLQRRRRLPVGAALQLRVRADQLPPRPLASRPADLDRRSRPCAACADLRRPVAVDPVHDAAAVRRAAFAAGSRGRGGAHGWIDRLADRVAHLSAAVAADHRHRADLAGPDDLQAVRHHLRADRRRTRHGDRKPGLLHLYSGLPLLQPGVRFGPGDSPARSLCLFSPRR